MADHENHFDGRCHCGNVRFLLHTGNPLQEITLRICRCDFCLRHRPRYWSDSNGTLEISISNMHETHLYRFGHGTADFLVCRICGVFCFAITATEDGYRAVTNFNLALDRDAVLPEAFLEALAENGDERMARRARNWTPVVSGWPA